MRREKKFLVFMALLIAVNAYTANYGKFGDGWLYLFFRYSIYQISYKYFPGQSSYKCSTIQKKCYLLSFAWCCRLFPPLDSWLIPCLSQPFRNAKK